LRRRRLPLRCLRSSSFSPLSSRCPCAPPDEAWPKPVEAAKIPEAWKSGVSDYTRQSLFLLGDKIDCALQLKDLLIRAGDATPYRL
ncbi:hypothetical protein PMAYCL1PPCAC_10874, partial [Pristionchus mayeri]